MAESAVLGANPVRQYSEGVEATSSSQENLQLPAVSAAFGEFYFLPTNSTALGGEATNSPSHVLYMGISYPLACSQDIKLLPNESIPLSNGQKQNGTTKLKSPNSILFTGFLNSQWIFKNSAKERRHTKYDF